MFLPKRSLFAVFKQCVGCSFHLLDRDEGGVDIAQCYFLPVFDAVKKVAFAVTAAARSRVESS